MDYHISDTKTAKMSEHVPIVIVLSEGTVSPQDIITNIRKIPIEEDQINFGSSELVGLKHHLVTKYYETDILFIPYDKPLSTLPPPLQIFVEGLLIYFDAHNRDIMKTIKTHLEYLDMNHIEMVILLCDKLFDEERLGITYKEIKQSSRLMDVIELGRTKDDADIEENYDHHDPVGYDELLQVLQNFLWSNVEMKGASQLKVTSKTSPKTVTTSVGDPNDAALLTQPAAPADSAIAEEAVEAELAGFEKLLTELMMFKNNASTLSQNERFAYTQNFADAFDDLIGDGADSSADDEDLVIAAPDKLPGPK